MNYEIFSQRLKEARNNKNMTQRQLADKIGVSATTLTNYETNKSKVPGADTLVLLAEALDVSIDWLLGNEKKSQENNRKTLNNITREDIKEAVNILFTAFEFKLSFEDCQIVSRGVINDDPVFRTVNRKAIVIDEDHFQTYLENYQKLLSVDIDRTVLNTVFDAIFPKGQYDSISQSFEYYDDRMPF